MADALGWLLPFIAALVQEGWVLPRFSTGSCAQSARTAAVGHHRLCADSLSTLGSVYALAEAGVAPQAALMRCYKFLRPGDPGPPARLMINGSHASLEDSHRAWCYQVSAQREWPNPYHAEYDVLVRSRVQCAVGRHRTSRGHSKMDAPVSQPEVARVVADLGHSSATTPDLVPRVLFQLDDACWDRLVWLIQRILGPGALALRPKFWRGRWQPLVHRQLAAA